MESKQRRTQIYDLYSRRMQEKKHKSKFSHLWSIFRTLYLLGASCQSNCKHRSTVVLEARSRERLVWLVRSVKVPRLPRKAEPMQMVGTVTSSPEHSRLGHLWQPLSPLRDVTFVFFSVFFK